MADSDPARSENERNQAAEGLRERDELFRVLTEHATDFIRVHDLDGRSVYASPSVERLYGRVPTTLFEFAHPEDLETCQRWWKKILAGETHRLYWRVRAAAGNWRYLETSAALVPYHGKPHVLTVCRDITERKRAEDKLQESEDLLRLLTENTGEFIRLFDTAGKLAYANPSVAHLLKAVPADFPGYPHPEDVEPSLRWFQHTLAGGKEFLHWRVRAKSGEWRWMETQGAVVSYHGTPHVLTVCRDITDRRQAEEALRDNQKLLQLVLATLPVGVAVTDLAGDIIIVNAASKRIWGDIIVSGRERRARSKGFWHESGKRIEPESWASLRALREGQTTLNELIDINTFDAQKKTIQNSAAPIRNAEGFILGAVIVNEDVTERVRAEQALAEFAARLQRLSRRLLEVQEEERRHIARDLHDEFGQLLATITLHLHAARSAAGEAAGSHLDECMALLQRAGAQVRSLALELRPTMLESAGLDATLHWLAEQHQQRTGTATRVEGHVNGVPGDLAIACFRVTQEALTNIVRHARAQHIWIELRQSESLLELAVRDDGVGFDVETTLHRSAARGNLGLLGMRERVAHFGGRLNVNSAPGRGTRIGAEFPMIEAAQEGAERGE